LHEPGKKYYKATLCYLASACVLAFLWLVCDGRAALLFFLFIGFVCLAKKNKCAASKRWQATKKCRAGGNTAEGLCAVGSVCWLKPKPCCVSAMPGFILLLMVIDVAGLCTAVISKDDVAV
jgi:hypothetical protein